MTRKSVRISDNFQAKTHDEFDKMVSIQVVDKDLSITDFIFNEDRSLKYIKSELTKEQLIKIMVDLVNDHYDKYK
jgi:hypothetical protein